MTIEEKYMWEKLYKISKRNDIAAQQGQIPVAISAIFDKTEDDGLPSYLTFSDDRSFLNMLTREDLSKVTFNNDTLTIRNNVVSFSKKEPFDIEAEMRVAPGAGLITPKIRIIREFEGGVEKI